MVSLEAAKAAVHIHIYSTENIYIYTYITYIFTVWYEDLNNSSMPSSSKFHYLRMRTGSSPLLSPKTNREWPQFLQHPTWTESAHAHTRARTEKKRRTRRRDGWDFREDLCGYLRGDKTERRYVASFTHTQTHTHTHTPLSIRWVRMRGANVTAHRSCVLASKPLHHVMDITLKNLASEGLALWTNINGVLCHAAVDCH